MIRARSHVSTLLKLTLVSACAAMVILWPTWRVALQEQGYYLEGRMTGGGNCTVDDIKVTHGFTLHCDPGEGANNLEVNWRDDTGSHQFHLEDLTLAECSDNGLNPEHPEAGFDTYRGEGTGRFDGVSDAKAFWTFTDQGEPGKDNDTLVITIGSVLSIDCTLDGGNHQAHPE
jgi:hypothetical protein